MGNRRIVCAVPRRGNAVAALAMLALLLAGCGTIAPPAAPVALETPTEPAPPAPSPAQSEQPELQTRSPAPPPLAAKPLPAPRRDTADAVPRIAPIAAGAPNLPYAIRGRTYVPATADVPMVETGIASWYGEPFHGRPTATGEVYDMDAMSAAHKTMPLPSYALVRNRANGRQVVVRVNDRGPFVAGRVIDLSRAAARKLRIDGVAEVELRRLTHHEIRSGAWKVPATALASAE